MPDQITIRLTHGTKTNKRSRQYQEPVTLALHEDPKLCFLRHLWAYLQLAHVVRDPITHYLFRPLTDDKTGFKSQTAYSGCSMTKMVRKHLEDLGQYSGETAHSFRRGDLQAVAS